MNKVRFGDNSISNIMLIMRFLVNERLECFWINFNLQFMVTEKIELSTKSLKTFVPVQISFRFRNLRCKHLRWTERNLSLG